MFAEYLIEVAILYNLLISSTVNILNIGGAIKESNIKSPDCEFFLFIKDEIIFTLDMIYYSSNPSRFAAFS